jgi:hypothetical protein
MRGAPNSRKMECRCIATSAALLDCIARRMQSCNKENSQNKEYMIEKENPTFVK